MTRKGEGRHNLEELATMPWYDMTRGQRIAAVKVGLIPPVRSERERQLRTRYNMLLEDYDDLLMAQGGVCASCGEKWKNLLFVDHDHRTGKVRGLLCAACNTLCGKLEESDTRFWQAWNYLHQNWLVQV